MKSPVLPNNDCKGKNEKPGGKRVCPEADIADSRIENACAELFDAHAIVDIAWIDPAEHEVQKSLLLSGSASRSRIVTRPRNLCGHYAGSERKPENENGIP